MLCLEFKTRILPPLEGNDKCHKMNSNNNNTLSKCPGGHPVLHQGSKLNWKISAVKYKKGKFTGDSWFSTGELSKNYV